jgi:branched-chain amino acid aminotransferase
LQKEAEKLNCQQVLWLFGPDHELTEVGAMNIFVFLDHGNGKRELVTPSLESGIILPGVTRRSIVELTQGWGEFEVSERKITMPEVMEARSQGRVLEVFGAGTAAVVSPVGGIYYDGKMQKIPTPEKGLATRILSEMCDIHYGRVAHPWAVEVEDWKVDSEQEMKDYFPPQSAVCS